MCDSPRTGCVWWTTLVRREQAEIKLVRRGIFIVAWCDSVKVCALAALPVQSQQSGALTRMWRWCQAKPSQKERAIGAVCWKNKGCCCNLSVGVALKVWFLHAQYVKMTRDDHVLGFKSYDISIYWLIWKLSFCLNRIGLEWMIFFWTSSQLSFQFWDCRLL